MKNCDGNWTKKAIFLVNQVERIIHYGTNHTLNGDTKQLKIKQLIFLDFSATEFYPEVWSDSR